MSGFAFLLAVLAAGACGGGREAAGSGGAAAAPASAGPGEGGAAGGPMCPEGMVYVRAFRGELGSSDPHGGGVIRGEGGEVRAMELARTEVRVGDFCIDRLPFPGRAGAAWPHDGLSVVGAMQLDLRLQRYGRRLCTASELTYAAAGPGNLRHPYGNAWDPTRCQAENPDTTVDGVLGSHPGCVSPLGVADFQVRSSWARLDAPMREALERQLGEPLPGNWYVSWGGTSRLETFYAPTNFSIHWHPPDGDTGHLDDGARVCRDPGPVDPALEARYQREVVDDAIQLGGFHLDERPPW